MFTERGEPFFSLYDTAARRGMWVGLNEPGQLITVLSYDADKGVVAVEYQGRSFSIALKQARVIAPAVAVGPVPGAAAPANTAAPQAIAGQIAPEEAARLAQITEEIRRRRALRAQALQLPQAAAPTQAPAPSAGPMPPANAPAPSPRP
jgi:hypothetical protein